MGNAKRCLTQGVGSRIGFQGASSVKSGIAELLQNGIAEGC